MANNHSQKDFAKKSQAEIFFKIIKIVSTLRSSKT